ncbi:Cytochrome c oxidase subunit I [[Clostridium] ultunense Esp]|nr:Cytochrome c oxidase subunit I [[Clostridium] ultunense Esp]
MKAERISSRDIPISLSHIYIGFTAVFLGAIFGILQGLVRGGIITLPSWISYYEILTAHGVLLALVFTTYFIFGYFYAGNSRTMGPMTPSERKIGWVGFWTMTLGTAMAAAMILTGQASVLYTFYLPLKASPIFYIGLALFVVGSWIEGAAMFMQYFRWRKEHPGEKTPLFGFMVTATNILWIIATIGVAITVLFQMIPLSLGWIQTVNVELSRTFFWYFGHPLVYFWLLPAYMIWYVNVPKLIGGKIFSDSLARLAFLLFIVFSMPVGFHHQLTEPGVQEGWKFLQVILTFMVVIPSLMTAFALFATFEQAGQAKGAKGIFGWVKVLPWGDVRFLAAFLAMLFFIPGGIGGLINASYQLDSMVHNTLWVVGHFHITVGTPVGMTFFAATYWLLPYLTGRKLTPFMNRMGILQTIFWSVGMLIMSIAMHTLGLEGAPRRTAFTTYNNNPVAQQWFEGFFGNYATLAVGGTILFIGAMLMIYNVIHLSFFAPKSEEEEFPLGEENEEAMATPRFLENWKLWITVSVVLILVAYTIPVVDLIVNSAPESIGYKTW